MVLTQRTASGCLFPTSLAILRVGVSSPSQRCASGSRAYQKPKPVSSFSIYLAAPPGVVGAAVDWSALEDMPWIVPKPDSCCGRAAELLFDEHEIRPGRVIRVDREQTTRALVAAGVGLGLLHAYTAFEAEARGEVELLCQSGPAVPVLFGHRLGRTGEPLLKEVTTILRGRNTSPSSRPPKL